MKKINQNSIFKNFSLLRVGYEGRRGTQRDDVYRRIGVFSGLSEWRTYADKTRIQELVANASCDVPSRIAFV